MALRCSPYPGYNNIGTGSNNRSIVQDRGLTLTFSAFFRLTRFDKPAGILLLWSPTAWALWLANRGQPSFRLFFLFLFGTLIMRAAGCVMNDIADRNIDRHVQRTSKRPLTAGEVSLPAAIIVLIVLLFIALLILIQLNFTCVYYALIALFLTFLYPFCKRFIQSPQLVLSLAFSMGIPMAYAASEVPLDLGFLILFIINMCWILAYDTEYAMADRVDDLKIGVKSTAILFGQWDTRIIAILQLLFHLLWIPLIMQLKFNYGFLFCWIIGAAILFYQQWLISNRNEPDCLRAFISNSWYGLIMWLGIMVQ